MFDIISWIRETIFRRPKLSSSIAGEELSEKQTTKMGYLLLVCMFFAIMSTAQWTLSIISDIPERPSTLPNCVKSMISNLDTKENSYTAPYYSEYGYGYNYNSCDLISENPEYNFENLYSSLLPKETEIRAYIDRISQLESDKRSANYNQQNNRSDYNSALTEQIARENNGIYDKNELQNAISDTKNRIANIESEIATLKESADRIRQENLGEITLLKEKYETAEAGYKKAILFHSMMVAILSFFFSGFVFLILYRLYVRRKIENSPHTIIFSVATFAYGLILLQVLVLFLWDIIPHRFLEWLLGWISIFTPLLYLVQFLWPVIIVAIFGYLIYRIQKRLYSPENIIKRFVTDKKCPNCGNSVDITKPFCPLCSHEIHVHCPHCHELTMKGMPYCSNCGGSLPMEDKIFHRNTPIFSKELEMNLSEITLEGVTGVTFILLDGTSFVSKRENIIKLTQYMIQILGKSEFSPNEFAPYLEKILVNIDKKGMSQSELDRVLGKIRTWVEVGGKVILNKK